MFVIITQYREMQDISCVHTWTLHDPYYCHCEMNIGGQVISDPNPVYTECYLPLNKLIRGPAVLSVQTYHRVTWKQDHYLPVMLCLLVFSESANWTKLIARLVFWALIKKQRWCNGSVNQKKTTPTSHFTFCFHKLTNCKKNQESINIQVHPCFYTPMFNHWTMINSLTKCFVSKFSDEICVFTVNLKLNIFGLCKPHLYPKIKHPSMPSGIKLLFSLT